MLRNCSLWRVASPFFMRPNKVFELRGLSRELGLAPTSVKNHLETLQKKELVLCKHKVSGKRVFPQYVASQSDAFRFYKKQHNQEMLYESKLIDFLIETCVPDVIVLFGSFQKGEDDEQSDVDIYVQSAEKSVDLRKFEQKLSKRIQLHFTDDFKRFSPELKNSLCNGVVLYGYLEAF